MDYNQEQFFHAQFDVPKMPFYMSYPMQNLYLTEMEYEKDMDRMKELYPKEVGRIVECVEDECDRMEYEGSLMFDEYPDRLMIDLICSHYRRRCVEVRQTIEATALSEEAARNLDAQPGIPALRILRRCISDRYRTLLITLSIMPSDRYAFNLNVRID